MREETFDHVVEACDSRDAREIGGLLDPAANYLLLDTRARYSHTLDVARWTASVNYTTVTVALQFETPYGRMRRETAGHPLRRLARRLAFVRTSRVPWCDAGRVRIPIDGDVDPARTIAEARTQILDDLRGRASQRLAHDRFSAYVEEKHR
ncbi:MULTISPECIES: hypothetical protein [Pimelobacter]|uniref:hypothetical protein n=1 Tax=Pimelobacter TaxID=2044 RepID=UPI001C041DA4|nr:MULTISPECIES: hypothetical protein [Pimelobacter]MBU2698872.1 hypothetical protein [Pimelobacter sp. 30-1]UUW93005.1 hypothetical protein M0M43_30695 [Pimelobacter simplex]UUW99038.1 hypothetical protein M0M48_30715 [Pimelobacter simplex]